MYIGTLAKKSMYLCDLYMYVCLSDEKRVNAYINVFAYVWLWTGR